MIDRFYYSCGNIISTSVSRIARVIKSEPENTERLEMDWIEKEWIEYVCGLAYYHSAQNMLALCTQH